MPFGRTRSGGRGRGRVVECGMFLSRGGDRMSPRENAVAGNGIRGIVEGHRGSRDSILLQDVQASFGHLPAAVLKEVAESTGRSRSFRRAGRPAGASRPRFSTCASTSMC